MVGVGHAATHWIAAIVYLLLPFLAESFDFSYAQAGSLIAVFHISSVCANLGSGVLVDVTGKRLTYQLISLLCGAAALALFAGANSFWSLAVLIAIIGAMNNLWHPAAISLLSTLYPKSRGYALSLHALGANLGDAAAPMIVGLALTWLAWPVASSLAAIPVVGVAALLYFVVAPAERRTRQLSSAEGGGQPIAAYFTGLARMTKDTVVMRLCLMAGFRTMTQVGLLTFLPLYFAHGLGLGPAAMGAALTLLQVGGFIASPLAGAWSDRIGRRPVVFAGLGLSTIVIFALALIDDEIVFIATVAVLGFVLFAVRPVVHGWMMDLTPPNMAGTGISLMFGIQAALGAAMPVIGGVIADQFGLNSVFYLLAGTILAANLMVLTLPAGTRAREA